jgi:hypothetical protein
MLENPSLTAVTAFEEQGFTVIKHAALPQDKLYEVSHSMLGPVVHTSPAHGLPTDHSRHPHPVRAQQDLGRQRTHRQSIQAALCWVLLYWSVTCSSPPSFVSSGYLNLFMRFFHCSCAMG